MLTDEKDPPFVDSLHYSPSFIKKIAKKIFEQVEKDLPGRLQVADTPAPAIH